MVLEDDDELEAWLELVELLDFEELEASPP